MRYHDHIEHYDIDAHDMPMPDDMGLFRRSLERRRFTVLARLVPRRGINRILDAGCGSGWLAELLAAKGAGVVALDIGLDSLKRAASRLRNHAGVIFTLGDLYRMPFRDNAFDAVVASEIVEHLDNPPVALAECRRLLRPGGILILATPYREIIEQTLCIHCNRKTPVNAHLHSFDETAVATILRDAGFDVLHVVRFVSRPGERIGLAAMTSWLPHVVWRTFDALLCGLLGRQNFIAVTAIRK